MGVMQVLVVAFWITVITFGIGGFVRGWQMRTGNRLDLITDTDYRPLPNPTRYAKVLGQVYFGFGAVMFVLLVVNMMGLTLLICAALAAIFLWCWFITIDRIADRARLDHGRSGEKG